MLRSVLLGLLLASATSLASSAVILDNGWPIMWAETSSQLSELPAPNGIVTPNPWNYLQRMSLIRLLIGATNSNMTVVGFGGTESPLWGLTLQLAWMQTSGVNYFSSVLPFLSAVQQGFLGADVQVNMELPEGQVFCTTYAECALSFPDAMSKWDAFYQGLKTLDTSDLPEGEKKDSVLGLLWAAQTASSSASSSCNTSYSSTEQAFAKSWESTAAYVAAAHFQSSLENAAMFTKNLPGRVLKAEDKAPNIADLSQEEKHTLLVFSWMSYMDSLLGGSLARMWKSAMCSVTTREKGRETLGQLLLDPGFATASLLSILTEMTTSC